MTDDRPETPTDPTLQAVPAEPGERVYFPELDGLRFVAFLLVYLFHQGVPQFTGWVSAVRRLLPEAWWLERRLSERSGGAVPLERLGRRSAFFSPERVFDNDALAP